MPSRLVARSLRRVVPARADGGAAVGIGERRANRSVIPQVHVAVLQGVPTVGERRFVELEVVRPVDRLTAEIEVVARFDPPVVLGVAHVVVDVHGGVAEVESEIAVEPVDGMRIEIRQLIDPHAVLAQTFGDLADQRPAAAVADHVDRQLRQRRGQVGYREGAEQLVRDGRADVGGGARVPAEGQRAGDVGPVEQDDDLLRPPVRRVGPEAGRGDRHRPAVVPGVGDGHEIARLVREVAGLLRDRIAHRRHPVGGVGAEPVRDERHAGKQSAEFKRFDEQSNTV